MIPTDEQWVELLARVEMLEFANEARTLEIKRLTNAVANQVPDRTRLFTDAMADPDDYDPFGSSLVQRVQAAIRHSYSDDARAAIHLIAGELRTQCFVDAADWLEQEARR